MDDARTVFVGNIADQVTEELLYELFLQAGPLEKVKIPTDREGRKSSFGFITFKHEVSVPYAVQLLNGVRLFERSLNIKPRKGGSQKDKQIFEGNPIQRSISYPVETYNLLHHQQNDYNRFDDRGGMGPQHVSFEDLLRMGAMMNIAYNSPENIFSNMANAYGGSLAPNRNQNDRSNINDRNRERDRREYDRPKNDYNRDRDNRDRDRHRDYSSNRNQRGNQDKRNNYDRNNARRNNRYY